MITKHSFCIIFLSLLVHIESHNYGYFDVVLKKFEFCKGPKTKNCTSGTTKIFNETTAYVDLIVHDIVLPTKGKVIASVVGIPETMRLQLNKPCDNLFLKAMFFALFNANTKCEIPKGEYKISLNFRDMVRKYYNGKQYYGVWKFKSCFFNNDCNFVCTQTEIDLIPLSS